VLTTSGPVRGSVMQVWNNLDRWPHLNKKWVNNLNLAPRKYFIPKRSYSLTSDINTFEACPAQYSFYREDRFSPSRSASSTFGILVHQTIEDIHKEVLKGKLGAITNERVVSSWFEPNYYNLLRYGMRPLSLKKYTAMDHVLDYFNQNYDNLERIVEAEVDISVEKFGYILTGRIDLLMGNDNKLEILDFKTQQRPVEGYSILEKLYLQLCIYAHILRERYHKSPARAYIYWTGERDRHDAMMEFRLYDDDIESSIRYFEDIVQRIERKEFKVERPPAAKICMECDFRKYCMSQGIISSIKI
jgi:DNA helicase-2/ATP-dependent DNA helicase PcrA